MTIIEIYTAIMAERQRHMDGKLDDVIKAKRLIEANLAYVTPDILPTITKEQQAELFLDIAATAIRAIHDLNLL